MVFLKHNFVPKYINYNRKPW